MYRVWPLCVESRLGVLSLHLVVEVLIWVYGVRTRVLTLSPNLESGVRAWNLDLKRVQSWQAIRGSPDFGVQT